MNAPPHTAQPTTQVDKGLDKFNKKSKSIGWIIESVLDVIGNDSSSQQDGDQLKFDSTSSSEDIMSPVINEQNINV